jgi:uncharacterized protein YbjT (DUF2867 family)
MREAIASQTRRSRMARSWSRDRIWQVIAATERREPLPRSASEQIERRAATARSPEKLREAVVGCAVKLAQRKKRGAALSPM